MILSSVRFSVRIAFVVTMVAAIAAAQRGTGSGSTNTPSRNIPSTNRSPNSTDALNRPIFISGKVTLEGGGPLPEPVPIERVCNGRVRREGYSDLKGQFELQLGTNLTFQDASEDDNRTSPTGQVRGGSSRLENQ